MDTAPIILTAAMAAEDHRWATALRSRHFPPERNHLSAHITLFHHLPGTMEGEIARTVKAMIADIPAPAARIDRLLDLGRGVALHVESPALLTLRADLAHAFHGLLTPQDQAKPRLHITVQNKVTPADARALLTELEHSVPLPRPLRIIGIAAHRYRGGPWEELALWRFKP